MSPLQQAMLSWLLSQSKSPKMFSADALAFYADKVGRDISPGSAREALNQLREAEPPVIWRSSHRDYALKEFAMADWYARRVERGECPPPEPAARHHQPPEQTRPPCGGLFVCWTICALRRSGILGQLLDAVSGSSRHASTRCSTTCSTHGRPACHSKAARSNAATAQGCETGRTGRRARERAATHTEARCADQCADLGRKRNRSSTTRSGDGACCEYAQSDLAGVFPNELHRTPQGAGATCYGNRSTLHPDTHFRSPVE